MLVVLFRQTYKFYIVLVKISRHYRSYTHEKHC